MRVLLLLASLPLAACTSPGWEGQVDTWGTLWEVMHDGQTHGRVRVIQATAPDVVGIGALAGLAGEVSIVDGAVWISRAGPGKGLITTSRGAGDEEAALLVTASVEEWEEIEIDHEMGLAEMIALTGFPAGEWAVAPFVVKGRLIALDTHVIHGACPHAGDVPPGKEPVRRHEERAFGTLVGFWARDGGGKITHAGGKVHAHVVVHSDLPWTAHVDAVRIGTGSTLRVPRVLSNKNLQNRSLLRPPQ